MDVGSVTRLANCDDYICLILEPSPKREMWAPFTSPGSCQWFLGDIYKGPTISPTPRTSVNVENPVHLNRSNQVEPFLHPNFPVLCHTDNPVIDWAVTWEPVLAARGPHLDPSWPGHLVWTTRQLLRGLGLQPLGPGSHNEFVSLASSRLSFPSLSTSKLHTPASEALE